MTSNGTPSSSPSRPGGSGEAPRSSLEAFLEQARSDAPLGSVFDRPLGDLSSRVSEPSTRPDDVLDVENLAPERTAAGDADGKVSRTVPGANLVAAGLHASAPATPAVDPFELLGSGATAQRWMYKVAPGRERAIVEGVLARPSLEYIDLGADDFTTMWRTARVSGSRVWWVSFRGAVLAADRRGGVVSSFVLYEDEDARRVMRDEVFAPLGRGTQEATWRDLVRSHFSDGMFYFELAEAVRTESGNAGTYWDYSGLRHEPEDADEFTYADEVLTSGGFIVEVMGVEGARDPAFDGVQDRGTSELRIYEGAEAWGRWEAALHATWTEPVLDGSPVDTPASTSDELALWFLGRHQFLYATRVKGSQLEGVARDFLQAERVVVPWRSDGSAVRLAPDPASALLDAGEVAWLVGDIANHAAEPGVHDRDEARAPLLERRRLASAALAALELVWDPRTGRIASADARAGVRRERLSVEPDAGSRASLAKAIARLQEPLAPPTPPRASASPPVAVFAEYPGRWRGVDGGLTLPVTSHTKDGTGPSWFGTLVLIFVGVVATRWLAPDAPVFSMAVVLAALGWHMVRKSRHASRQASITDRVMRIDAVGVRVERASGETLAAWSWRDTVIREVFPHQLAGGVRGASWVLLVRRPDEVQATPQALTLIATTPIPHDDLALRGIDVSQLGANTPSTMNPESMRRIVMQMFSHGAWNVPAETWLACWDAFASEGADTQR